MQNYRKATLKFITYVVFGTLMKTVCMNIYQLSVNFSENSFIDL